MMCLMVSLSCSAARVAWKLAAIWLKFSKTLCNSGLPAILTRTDKSPWVRVLLTSARDNSGCKALRNTNQMLSRTNAREKHIA